MFLSGVGVLVSVSLLSVVFWVLFSCMFSFWGSFLFLLHEAKHDLISDDGDEQ